MNPPTSHKHSSPAKILAFFLVAILFLPSAKASTHEEILLTIRHSAVGHVYVGTLYDYQNNQVYLPVMELFSRFEINFQPEVRNFTIKGNFITPNNPYEINLSAMRVKLGTNVLEITADDFRMSETEYFLAPWVFEEVFGLNFTVNINHLSLRLETTHTLPIQDRLARERARSRMEGRQLPREHFPLEYGLNRSFFAGSMIDYSITGEYLSGNGRIGYTLAGGMQFLGGDMQGTVYGSHASTGENSINASGLRWQLAIPNNNILTGITAGQISTSGIQGLPIRGVSITNDPIEPRRMYETFVIDGTTEPESEVEIYANDRLTDYARANELGYYRFDVPITYGTTRISIRIFTPSGEIIVSDRQIQVPFSFLPPGVVSYNIQAGKAERFLDQSLADQWAAHANLGIGINRWLTATVGAQHLGNQFDADNIMSYATISSRIARQYLVSLDAAPNNFYRLSGSVMYPNNTSINFNYTKFDGQTIYNTRNATDQMGANIYLPLRVLGTLAALRFGGDHTILQNSSITTYNADLSARLGRVNMRLNFRDNLIAVGDNINFGQGLLTSSLTYTVSRSPGIPVYVRGMFARVQNQLAVGSGQLVTSELQLSRTVLKTGRLNINVAYNHLNRQLNTQLGLTLDLNALRSVTTVNTVGSNVLARQRFNGSIGWDMPNGAITMSNRQQVGKSAAAVIMFVDQNENSQYDKGEQLLPYRGVRLDRAISMRVGRDSILRLEQLQSYFRYNLSVNRNAIADPTLVPLKDNFSFIADPNQYKRIEIPFYRGGIIEGMVVIRRGERTLGQGGLRLEIKGLDNGFVDVIRTFSDGGFYAMDIPPGRYTLMVDQTQQGFLSATQKEPFKLEIQASAEGDYQEGLLIILVAETETEILITPTPRQDNYLPMLEDGKKKEIEQGLNTIDEPMTSKVADPFDLKYFAEKPYVIQVGVFRNHKNAIKLVNQVAKLTNHPVRIIEDQYLHKVQVLGFETLRNARTFERILKNRGLSTFVFKVK